MGFRPRVRAPSGASASAPYDLTDRQAQRYLLRRWTCASPPRTRPSATRSAPSSRTACATTSPSCGAGADRATTTACSTSAWPGSATSAPTGGPAWPGPRSTAAGACRCTSRSSTSRSTPGPAPRAGSATSARRSSARPSSPSAPTRSGSASCPGSSPAPSSGARGTASRARDPTSPTCRPAPSGSTGEWSIDGQKVWTSQAHWADWCFVLARTNREARQAQGHLVPAGADAPGRRRDPAHPPDHRRLRVQRGVLRRRPGRRPPTSSARSTAAGGWRWARSRSSAARPRSASNLMFLNELDEVIAAARANGAHPRRDDPPAPGRLLARPAPHAPERACGIMSSTHDAPPRGHGHEAVLGHLAPATSGSWPWTCSAPRPWCAPARWPTGPPTSAACSASSCSAAATPSTPAPTRSSATSSASAPSASRRKPA